MYVITKKSKAVGFEEDFDLFYQFSHDETDLYCVATANLQTCRKYTEDEKKRLSNSNLLSLMNVTFKKVNFSL